MTDPNTPEAAPKKDVKALLANAQRPIRKLDICTRGDLVDAYETLDARLKALGDVDQLGGHPDAAPIRAQLEALREQMRDSEITFVIRGLDPREYTKLLAQHPPRDGVAQDKAMGFNVDEMVDKLIRLGTEEPELDEEDWENLFGRAINKATYAQLTNAAWSANAIDVSVPFS